MYAYMYVRTCIHTVATRRPALYVMHMHSYRGRRATCTSAPVSHHKAKCVQLAFFFFFFFFLQRQINVTLPSKTLRNGTLYAYVYLGPKGRHPQQHSQYVAASSAPLTRYSVPEMTAFNLLSGENHVSFEQGRARLILLSERFGPRTM